MRIASGATSHEVLEQNSRELGASVALISPGRPPMTHARLFDTVVGVADRLRGEGVDRTTRVALILPDGAELAVAMLAVFEAGVCVPLVASQSLADLRGHLERTRAQIAILGGEASAELEACAAGAGVATYRLRVRSGTATGSFDLVHVGGPRGQRAVAATLPRPDDVALLLQTSGSTGRPKLVPIRQRHLMVAGRVSAEGCELGPEDVCLQLMSLCYTHGLNGCLVSTLMGGGSMVCTGGYDADRFFEWCRDYGPTWYSAVPTIHRHIVSLGAQAYRDTAPDHRFRFVRSTSSALGLPTKERLEAMFGAPTIDAYGQTEAMRISSERLPPAVRKPGSVGQATGVEIRIVDAAGVALAPGVEGDILVRGPVVIDGYEDAPEANARSFVDGWYRTGDRGWLDEDGFLFFAGRGTDRITRGGLKVSTRELDEALVAHPQVSEGVAFAVPHPTLGEDVWAAVVPMRGARLDEHAIREYLIARLAAYKVPTRVIVVASLPRNANEKIVRRGMSDWIRTVPAPDEAEVAPGTESEVAATFAGLLALGEGELRPSSNFFALGGDSLVGLKVVARLNERFGADLQPPDLFRWPTVRQLALRIDARTGAPDGTTERIEREIEALSDEEVRRLLDEETRRQQ